MNVSYGTDIKKPNGRFGLTSPSHFHVLGIQVPISHAKASPSHLCLSQLSSSEKSVQSLCPLHTRYFDMQAPS